MNYYKCKRCGFTGTRQEVRKHIRFEHLIKSSKKLSRLNTTEEHQSSITPNMISIEF